MNKWPTSSGVRLIRPAPWIKRRATWRLNHFWQGLIQVNDEQRLPEYLLGGLIRAVRRTFVLSSPFVLVLFHSLSDLRVGRKWERHFRNNQPFGQSSFEIKPFSNIGWYEHQIISLGFKKLLQGNLATKTVWIVGDDSVAKSSRFQSSNNLLFHCMSMGKNDPRFVGNRSMILAIALIWRGIDLALLEYDIRMRARNEHWNWLLGMATLWFVWTRSFGRSKVCRRECINVKNCCAQQDSLPADWFQIIVRNLVHPLIGFVINLARPL